MRVCPLAVTYERKTPRLPILDPASGSAVLQANTSRFLAPFGKTGFIDGHNGRYLAQLLKHVGAQVIAHAIGVPDSVREQALHPIGTSFSRMFSQLPPVFAFRFTQDPLQIGQRSVTRLRTGKAWSNTGMQSKKGLGSAADIGGGRPGSGEGGMLILLHDLFLSHEISEGYLCTHRVSHG